MALSVRDTGGGFLNSNTLDMGSVMRNNSDVATAAAGGGYIQNPPFDARLGQRGAVDSDGKFVTLPREAVERGFIMTNSAPKPGGSRYLLHFQFNPTSFSQSASLSANAPTNATPDEVENPKAGGSKYDWMAFLPSTGQSVAFNLLFDRTYETWFNDGQTFASTQGCLADIKTLYAMLGMYGAGADPRNVTQFTPQAVINGGNPMWVSFGPLMAYYGIIQSVEVSFTHFTQKMTPVRAAVGLSMALIPHTESPNEVPDAGSMATWVNNPDMPNNADKYLPNRTSHNQNVLDRKGIS